MDKLRVLWPRPMFTTVLESHVPENDEELPVTPVTPPETADSKKQVPDTATPRAAGLMAVFSAVTAAVLICLACYHYNRDLYPQVTLSRHHYAINISGYACFVHAIVAHRIYSHEKHLSRFIHVGSHICGMSLVIAGIIIKAVAKTTYTLPNGSYEYNLFTLHSLIALATISIILIQLSGTKLGFEYLRKKLQAFTSFVQFHREVGMFLLTALTAVVSTGIQQLFTLSNCLPLVNMTHPNTNPAATYGTLPTTCKLLNGAGFLVYVASFLAATAVSGFSLKKFSDIFVNV